MLSSDFKQVLSFLNSLPGLISLLPSILAIATALGNWLMLPPSARPVFALLAIAMIALAVISEASRYRRVPKYTRHIAKVTYFVAFIVLFTGYFGAGMYLEAHPPEEDWIIRFIPYILAIIAALAFGALARDFAILALEIHAGCASGSSRSEDAF